MKKLLFLFTMLAFMFACDDDDKNDTPISGLDIPKFENPVTPGQRVTIKGEGFNEDSEIWFRQIVTKAADNDDVKAEVTDVNATGITFIAPEVYGNQSVLLKQDGMEYKLGEMLFADQPEEPADVKILPKRIKNVTDDRDLTKFEYDAEGRIKSCDWGKDDIEYYTYSDNMITCRQEYKGEYDGESKLILENGRIKTYSWKNDEWSEKYELEYDEKGYLSKSIMTDYENDSEIETFSFVGGNLVKYTYIDEGLDGWNGSIEFTYGEQPNNLNIDFFYFINYFDGNINDVFLFNMIGKRSRCLPVEMKVTDPVWDREEENIIDHQTYTVKFEYEMNGEYISKVTMRGGENKGGGEAYRIITLEYED